MRIESPEEGLQRRWTQFCETLTKPLRCIACPGSRLTWKGWRTRGVSVLVDDQIVYDPAVPVRRVRCCDCRRSWTLEPPGVIPRKHYQLDVVAHAAAAYVFDPRATLEGVAATFQCARRTVGRWITWIGALASPAALLNRLATLTQTPFVPRRSPGPLDSRPRHPCRERAAEALTLFEALGTALGTEPPGLRAVLERLGCAPSYHAPALPDPLPLLAR